MTTPTAGLQQLIELFNLDSKKAVQKHCRKVVITSKDLFHIILAGRGGALDPYLYACHFSEYVPEHLHLSEENCAALQANGIGPFKPGAQTTANKIFETFEQRRLFAAHLFYTPSFEHWHLLFFDQRDQQADGNHWIVGGTHIHYSRETLCREPLPVVWERLCERPSQRPGSVHIRYEDIRQRN